MYLNTRHKIRQAKTRRKKQTGQASEKANRAPNGHLQPMGRKTTQETTKL
jgi:hypothetical protein